VNYNVKSHKVADKAVCFALRKRTFTQRCSHWSKGQQFELQKAIAIAFPGATGLRNKAYREFRETILELERRAAVA
jgi:hypothetical protein